MSNKRSPEEFFKLVGPQDGDESHLMTALFLSIVWTLITILAATFLQIMDRLQSILTKTYTRFGAAGGDFTTNSQLWVGDRSAIPRAIGDREEGPLGTSETPGSSGIRLRPLLLNPNVRVPTSSWDGRSQRAGGHAHRRTLSKNSLDSFSMPLVTSSRTSTRKSSVSGDTDIGNTGSYPTQLLSEAFNLFESHLSKLPQATTMHGTCADVLKDGKTMVDLTIALSNTLRVASANCLEKMVEVETTKQASIVDSGEVFNVWKHAEAEFKADAKAVNQLVRTLTSFTLGIGRVLQSISKAGAVPTVDHNQTPSGDERAATVISRPSSRSSYTSENSSASSAGASSDENESVESWDHVGDWPSAETDTNDASSGTTKDNASPKNTSQGAAPRNRDFQVYDHDGSRPSLRLSMAYQTNSDPKRMSFTSRSASLRTPASTQEVLMRSLSPTFGSAPGISQTAESDHPAVEPSRLHVRHSSMSALVLPSPIPLLDSELSTQRNINVKRHRPFHSVSSALPTKGKLLASIIVPATDITPKIALTPPTAIPSDIANSPHPEDSSPRASTQDVTTHTSPSYLLKKTGISTTDNGRPFKMTLGNRGLPPNPSAYLNKSTSRPGNMTSPTEKKPNTRTSVDTNKLIQRSFADSLRQLPAPTPFAIMSISRKSA